MGTFVAILLGNVAGGLLLSIPESAREAGQGGPRIALAWIGRRPPRRPCRIRQSRPEMKIKWKSGQRELAQHEAGAGKMVVFRSARHLVDVVLRRIFLSQSRPFAKEVLHGDAAGRFR